MINENVSVQAKNVLILGVTAVHSVTECAVTGTSKCNFKTALFSLKTCAAPYICKRLQEYMLFILQQVRHSHARMAPATMADLS